MKTKIIIKFIFWRKILKEIIKILFLMKILIKIIKLQKKNKEKKIKDKIFILKNKIKVSKLMNLI